MRNKERGRKYSDREKSKMEKDSMEDKKEKWGSKGMDKDDRKIVKEAIHKSSKEGHHNMLCNAIFNLFDRIERKEDNIGKLKKMFIMELYETVNGKHFDEMTAMNIVEDMENVDGTEGEHFSMETCRNLMSRYKMGPKDDKYNEWDWYVIINMMWSDYAMVLGDKDEIYVAMTDAYFNGPDEDEGKAWTQMSYKLFEDDDDEDEDDDNEDEE